MMHKALLASLLTLSLTTSFESKAYDAPYAKQTPIVDGIASDAAWQSAQWHNIDQLTLGAKPSKADFQGRFKAVWRDSSLYLMAEITDDTLIDTHPHPLTDYWEDDTFEVFLDEDQSGGDHLNSYNAFAYHISIDNQAVDINQEGKPRLLNEHVSSVWKRKLDSPNTVVWEVSIDVYTDKFADNQSTEQSRQALSSLSIGKKMGFLVAYCDSDGDGGRESFLGSLDVPAIDGNKNRAYIDASVFDTITLTK